jgi:hypothetical protein
LGLLRSDFNAEGGTKRAGRSDTIFTPALVLDVDAYPSGIDEEGTRRLKTREAALKALDLLPVKAGAVVSSRPGHGLHAYVLLKGDVGAYDNDADFARLEALRRRLHIAVKGDGGQDRARGGDRLGARLRARLSRAGYAQPEGV